MPNASKTWELEKGMVKAPSSKPRKKAQALFSFSSPVALIASAVLSQEIPQKI